MYKEIMNVLSTDVFKRITSGEILSIVEINAIINLLLKANIPYDMSFSPGNRRFAKEVSITIYITPAVTISLSIQFEAGSIVL